MYLTSEIVNDTLAARRFRLLAPLVLLLALVALVGRPEGGAAAAGAMVVLAALGGFGCLGWNGLYTTVVAECAGRRSAPALGMSMTVLYVFTMLAPPASGS